jgi:hypothetical protein
VGLKAQRSAPTGAHVPLTLALNTVGAISHRQRRTALDRGFTMMRDVAGADHGATAAQAEGTNSRAAGVFDLRALSQTSSTGIRGPAADR